MADKKEVSILLLGIVAILAIVGLVLLFTSPAATGQAWQPPAPQTVPEVQMPAQPGAGAQQVAGGQQHWKRGYNVLYVQTLEAAALPEQCPGGNLKTQMQTNVPYEMVPQGHECKWFACPIGRDSFDWSLACAPRPGLV